MRDSNTGTTWGKMRKGNLVLTSQAVIDDLVNKLNAQTDIPFVSEETEEKCIRWIVERVVPFVPEWAVVAMATVADGVTLEEVETLRKVMIDEVHKMVDRPGIPDWVERQAISFVVTAMLEYALKGNQMPVQH